MLRIKLVKSPIAENWRNQRTVEALGLRKVGQTIEKIDNPSIRGQVHAVKHLLTVWEGENATPLYDGTKVRKHATKKDKKPSETH